MPAIKVIEMLAQSPKSWEDAAQVALNSAQRTVRNIQSIWVKDFQATVEGGRIAQYRVNVKVSFLVEEI